MLAKSLYTNLGTNRSIPFSSWANVPLVTPLTQNFSSPRKRNFPLTLGRSAARFRSFEDCSVTSPIFAPYYPRHFIRVLRRWNLSACNDGRHRPVSQNSETMFKAYPRLVPENLVRFRQVADKFANFKAVGYAVYDLRSRADKANNHTGKLRDWDTPSGYEVQNFPKYATRPFTASNGKFHHSRDRAA